LVPAIRLVPLHDVAADGTVGTLLERLEVAGVLDAPALVVHHGLDPLEPLAVLGIPGQVAHQLPHLGNRCVELHPEPIA
jgi:hypothetical protein